MSSQSEVIDPHLTALRDWVRGAAARPLPTYGLRPWRRHRAVPDRQLHLLDGTPSRGPAHACRASPGT